MSTASAPCPDPIAADARAFVQAQKVLVGGVNSPIRAFRAVGGTPLFIERGVGAYVVDSHGHHLVDFVGSYGPLILGHAHPSVVAAVQQAASRGLTYGAPTHVEVKLAETVCRLVPSIERLRFVSSGTEAVMSALRLARGVTGRDCFIKFAGCYHGHADMFLSEAGSGLATFGLSASAGVPESIAALSWTLPFGDIQAVTDTMAKLGRYIAAVVVEPIACNMGLVIPPTDFLPTLRKLCDQHGSLLLFDEVITGFRVGLTGAQGWCGVKPDLTTFGKIIGGGMPVGAFGGAAKWMKWLSPCGPVFQAGTLSGNPVAMHAGLATLEILQNNNVYTQLEAHGEYFAQKLQQGITKANYPVRLLRHGSMFYLWFYKPHQQQIQAPRHFADIKDSDTSAYRRFFHAAIQQGLYFAPSAFEVAFIGLAHGLPLLEDAAQRCLQALNIAFAKQT